jgi:hypothetical protein
MSNWRRQWQVQAAVVALQLATLVSIWNLSDGWIYYFFKLKWVLKIEAKPYTVAIFEAYLYFCLFNQSINLSVLIRIRRIAQWPSNYRRTHWPPLTMLAIRQIWKDGGFPSLFKGLTPNLIGVTPARAIYFCTYSATKRYCNTYENIRDTAFVYLVSAVCGGFFNTKIISEQSLRVIDCYWLLHFLHIFTSLHYNNIYFLIGFVAATMVNPVSVVKTRLQLHQGRMGAWECMKRI